MSKAMGYLHLRKDLTQDDLIEIYCKLNAWEWDERIGEKPEGFERMTLHEKHPIVFPLMLQLSKLVPSYNLTRSIESFRYMSDDEFDAWYLTNKVEPMLNEWYTRNERRNAWRKEAYEVDNKVLENSPNNGKNLVAHIVSVLRKRF